MARAELSNVRRPFTCRGTSLETAPPGLFQSYPIPQNPESSPDRGTSSIPVSVAFTPKEAILLKNHGKSEGFGVFGVWGKNTKRESIGWDRPRRGRRYRTFWGKREGFDLNASLSSPIITTLAASAVNR
jgi:hypothetical protein